MHEHTNEIGRGSSAMTGFVLGALVGAGLALLMAPAAGVETRRRIGDAARRLGQDARHQVDRARTTLSELKEDAQSAVDAGREAFQRTRQQRSTDTPMSERSYTGPPSTRTT